MGEEGVVGHEEDVGMKREEVKRSMREEQDARWISGSIGNARDYLL